MTWQLVGPILSEKVTKGRKTPKASWVWTLLPRGPWLPLVLPWRVVTPFNSALGGRGGSQRSLDVRSWRYFAHISLVLSLFASKLWGNILHTFLDYLELNLDILDCLITQKWDPPNVHCFGFKWLLIHLFFVYWAKKYLTLFGWIFLLLLSVWLDYLMVKVTFGPDLTLWTMSWSNFICGLSFKNLIFFLIPTRDLAT